MKKLLIIVVVIFTLFLFNSINVLAENGPPEIPVDQENVKLVFIADAVANELFTVFSHDKYGDIEVSIEKKSKIGPFNNTNYKRIVFKTAFAKLYDFGLDGMVSSEDKIEIYGKQMQLILKETSLFSPVVSDDVRIRVKEIFKDIKNAALEQAKKKYSEKNKEIIGSLNRFDRNSLTGIVSLDFPEEETPDADTPRLKKNGMNF